MYFLTLCIFQHKRRDYTVNEVTWAPIA